ncbi:uncharacterized protein LOC118418187 [Branchiostoma floridae]|uniref:Uncharacterized protein LOC118418187 n=1 Tax=Branchiostoma floridae TaxID=7739 RepID=A0A9J7LDC2_BRAFL|nr:uncharacterized protein LOC118418187 [Branchiostoma floridae]
MSRAQNDYFLHKKQDYIWDDTHEDLTLSPPTPTPVIRQENQLHQFAASGPPYLSSSPLSYGSLDAAPGPGSLGRQARGSDDRKRLYSTTSQRQQQRDNPYDQDSYEHSTSELLPDTPGDQPTQTQEDLLIEVPIEPTVKVRQPRGADGDPGGDPGSPTRVPPGWREKERPQQQQLPQILTNGAILHTYWRIQHRLRFTSSALQRWLASWITLTIFWCITYILNWLKHNAIKHRLRFTSSALQRWLASWITLTIFWCITYILNWLKHKHRLRFTSSALQRWLASWITLTIFWCITYILNWLKHEHRLRFTSSALQRWLASWITLTIFWCITYILNWLKHKAIHA